MTTRESAIQSIDRYYDEGGFLDDLQRRVAIPTESQNPDRMPALSAYLEDEMRGYLERLGFECSVHPNPRPTGAPSSSASASRIRRCPRSSPTATAT
jgi:hypothetical protein